MSIKTVQLFQYLSSHWFCFMPFILSDKKTWFLIRFFTTTNNQPIWWSYLFSISYPPYGILVQEKIGIFQIDLGTPLEVCVNEMFFWMWKYGSKEVVKHLNKVWTDNYWALWWLFGNSLELLHSAAGSICYSSCELPDFSAQKLDQNSDFSFPF